jgi:hypothetical protein
VRTGGDHPSREWASATLHDREAGFRQKPQFARKPKTGTDKTDRNRFWQFCQFTSRYVSVWCGGYLPFPGVRRVFAIIGGCGEQLVRARLAVNSAGAHLGVPKFLQTGRLIITYRLRSVQRVAAFIAMVRLAECLQ